MSTKKLSKAASDIASALIQSQVRADAPQRVVGVKPGETYKQALARVDRVKALVKARNA